jgi:hypothetical protein
MNASDLSARLKGLLSIRAVLERAGVNESSYYTAAHRGSALTAERQAKLADALDATAADLRATAASLRRGGKSS